MEKTKCEKCGHTWLPRTEKPLCCPRCKNYLDRKSNKVAEKRRKG